MIAETAQDAAPVGFRPLYQQVRDRLVENLIAGTWAPGEALPAEHQLATQLGVSPGTVRKALDAMAAENLVVRRQGRGTYVAEHDQDRVLFQFFMMTRDDGTRELPDSAAVAVTRGSPTLAERQHLDIDRTTPVWRIDRNRTVDGRAIIAERIVVSAAMFPDLGRRGAVPNNVYQVYANDYGISVARAEERLKAVAAGPDDAARLGVTSGTPLLEIDRIAHALDGRPVEWRVSRCLTEDFHYLSELR